ncbi:MAG: hypothetical protein HY764_00890 [Candidatus Portnoybacteria bacterium]|nr:hypothetical protein [Candidatus Portnoybacteria bacterium]
MRKAKIGLIFLCLLAMPFTAQAEGMVKEWGLFFAGMGVGFVSHEAGHQIMAGIYGEKLDWGFDGTELRWEISADSKTRLRNIALGGTAAEILSSEILLRTKAPKDNSFIIGWLAWNIINPIRYVIRHEIGNGYGDLELIERNEQGLDIVYVEAIKIAHSLWTAYRLWNHQEFKQSRIRCFFGCSRDVVVSGLSVRF